MKTRARRASGNKNAPETKSDTASSEAISKKPNLTVISNDDVLKQNPVRPKVSAYPKRIKEVVRVEMKAANSNLPEVTMPGVAELDVPLEHITADDMNTPPSSRFDWSFAIWLVALVVAVNLALLMLVGSPSKSTNQPVAVVQTVVPAEYAPPAESGVVVSGPVAEEPARVAEVKPVAVVAPIQPVAPAPVPAKPVVVVAPAAAKPVPVAAKPVAAKPAADLLSLINHD